MNVLRGFIDEPAEKRPMHPEDFAALLDWVRAKEERETRRAR